MKWLLYIPLRAGSWLWRKSWLYVWLVSEFMHIPLGRLAPWMFGQMLGMKGTRMEQCERCGQTMDAAKLFRDYKATGASKAPGGGISISGHATPFLVWKCQPCNLAFPVQSRDKKRWQTIYDHQTKKKPTEP